MKLSPEERCCYEFALKQLEQVKYSPRKEAHRIAVRIVEVLKDKLNEK